MLHWLCLFEKKDRGVAVRERNSSKVPENEHVAPLLIEDVPCGRNALLAFHAGVDIEKMGQHHKVKRNADVAMLFLELERARNSEEEKNDPRDSNFRPHLQVDSANLRNGF